MFRTNAPVTAGDFHNREEEVRRLLDLVESLRKGAPRWLAIIGPRKVGKTSLVLEAARRVRRLPVDFVTLDILECAPLSPEIFRLYAARVVDRLFGAETGVSLEAQAAHPDEFRSALQRSRRFGRLPPDARGLILSLPEAKLTAPFIRACLDLPERLAIALSTRIVAAFDEFQELAGGAMRGVVDPLPVLRSIWQRHRNVAYIVSGSARSLLTELVAKESSPFFQHFDLMDLGDFPRREAVSLLTEKGAPGRRIPGPLARRAVEALGGHPFYLQLFGEALSDRPPPWDERTLKEVLQDLVFSRTGRLALYFENEFHRLVGRSAYLAAALMALAEGPRTLTSCAEAIHASSGAAVGYLERLGDAVRRVEEKYGLADPTFGLWLRWRSPGGTVVPMTVVGDEAERRAAIELSRMGFELVYQSRGSRGAFDLLAIRGSNVLAVQVKRDVPPLRFGKAEWQRMGADARRMDWRFVVAAVTPAEEVVFLDPAKAVRRGGRVALRGAIGNLLQWLEGFR